MKPRSLFEIRCPEQSREALGIVCQTDCCGDKASGFSRSPLTSELMVLLTGTFLMVAS